MKIIGMIKNYSRSLKYFNDKKSEDDSINLIDQSNSNEFIRVKFRFLRRLSLFNIIRYYLLLLLSIYLIVTLTPIKNIQSFIPNEIKSRKNFLIVIAHPDDESLFFNPTILGLISRNKLAHLIVLSNGNNNGLGSIRENEFKISCQHLNIDLSRCLSLNLTYLQDNPNIWWPKINVSNIIDFYINKFQIDLLITFDKYGISGHINHKSIYYGILDYIENNINNNMPMIYELSTISILFKFSSIFDLFRTILTYIPRLIINLLSTFLPFLISKPNDKHILFVNSPYEFYKGLKSFHSHRSQIVWFRNLYTIFSRYMFINDLNKIST